MPPRRPVQQLTSQQDPFHRHFRRTLCSMFREAISVLMAEAKVSKSRRSTDDDAAGRKPAPEKSSFICFRQKLGPMSTMDCLCQINGNQLEANITRNTFVLCWTFQIVNVATVLSSAQITDNSWRWSVADGEGRRTADRTRTLNCCHTFTYIHCVRMMT